MADYVNCPTCHGRGLIPLEDAARIGAHTQLEAGERQRAERQHRVAMVELDNKLRAERQSQTVAQRTAATEKRLADIEAVIYGVHQHVRGGDATIPYGRNGNLRLHRS